MDKEFYKNMPVPAFESLVEYYSTMKKQWNTHVISLRGSEIKKLVEVQKATAMFHPEWNHKFFIKKIAV